MGGGLRCRASLSTGNEALFSKYSQCPCGRLWFWSARRKVETFKIVSSGEKVQPFRPFSVVEFVVYSFLVVKEGVSSVELGLSVWMIE